MVKVKGSCSLPWNKPSMPPSDFRSVSVEPKLKAGHTVAAIAWVKESQFTTVSGSRE